MLREAKSMGVVATIFAAGIVFSGPVSAASAEDVIKARIDFMQDDIDEQWKVLAAFVKDGKGSLADVEKSARALTTLSKKIAGHFPKDTGRGKYPDNVTRALPAIWTDWQGFERDIQRFSEQTDKLARLARDGDKEGVVSLIGASGSYNRTNIGCAECHKEFRGPSAKRGAK